MFDENDFDAALACLDELGAAEPADPRHPYAKNTATQVMHRFREAFARTDIDALEDFFADGYERFDRRTVVSGADVHGRAAMRESTLALFDVGIRSVTGTDLAVRGERLALSRAAFVSGDDIEIGFLAVTEIDANDRLLHQTFFDPDALVDALDELDARYLAGPGPHGEETNAVARALNAGDWDALRGALTSDFILVDHRALGFPTLDREGLVEMFRGYPELASGIVTVQRRTHVRGSTRLHTVDVSAATSEGNVIEWSAHVVLVLDSAGRDSRQEWFPEDQFPAALARFDELGTAAPADPRHPRAENLAMTLAARFWELLVAGQIDAIRPLFADDAVMIDKRAIIGTDLVGADAIIANLHAVAEFGSTGVRVEPLAVRGSRLALRRTTMDFGTSKACS